MKGDDGGEAPEARAGTDFGAEATSRPEVVGSDPARDDPGNPPRPREDTEDPDDASPGVCELCGGPTIERHCKVVCQRCGYQRDCSDP